MSAREEWRVNEGEDLNETHNERRGEKNTERQRARTWMPHQLL